MDGKLHTLSTPPSLPPESSLLSLKVSVGDQVQKGTVMATYGVVGAGEEESSATSFKSAMMGKVCAVFHMEGDALQPNEPLFQLEDTCDHSIVVFDMCADCGLNLRRNSSTPENFLQPVSASVSMIHGIPELRVSQKEAEQLGNKDRLRLLTSRKLALIVDLDQTLVHTSMDPNIEPGLPDVYGFRLPDYHLLYHCRLRPHTRDFLEKVSKLYEMHVFTMGTKSYAASVTRILDPEGKFFCDRIISRDECFDPRSKALRLKSVFPCGDSMVAIIDDREDVWGRIPNLIHVKPYLFFTGTTDINAPPPRPLKPRPRHPRQIGKRLPNPPDPPRARPTKHKRAKVHGLRTTMMSSGATSLRQNGSETGMEHEPKGKPDSGTGLSNDAISNNQQLSVGARLEGPATGARVEEPVASGDVSMETEACLTTGIASSPDTVSPSTEMDVTQTADISTNNSNNNNNNGNSEEKAGDPPDQSASSDTSNTSSSNVGAVAGQGSDVVSSTEQEDGVTDNVPEQGASNERGGGVGTVEEQELGAATTPEQEVGIATIAGKERRFAATAKQQGGVEQSDSSDSSSDSSNDSSSSSSGIDDSIFDQPLESEHDSMGATGGSPVGSSGDVVSENAAAMQASVDVSSTTPQVGSGEVANVASSVAPPTPSGDQPTARQGWRQPLREIHDADDFLIHLMDILERIHTIFYESYDTLTGNAATTNEAITTAATSTVDPTDPPTPDLKEIISELRHSVLGDCRVLFTGVIPTNIPIRKNPEWNTARAFGATVHTQLVPGLNSSNQDDVKSATTHVITGKPGTSKLLEAQKMPGVKIVTPKWLWACAEQWKRADEALYCVRVEKQKRSNSRVTKHGEHENIIPKKGAILSEKESEQKNGEQAENEVVVPPPGKVEEIQGEPVSSDSEAEEGEDDIFRNSSFAELAKMDTNELKRHLSIESRLSVSDEELERMDAEVEAEISSSSDGSERGNKEGLGSHVEIFVDNEDELSYEKFAGTHASQDIDVVERLNRKRRFAELDASDSTDSLFVEPLNESVASDNDASPYDSGDDGDDELGALLGFGGGSH